MCNAHIISETSSVVAKNNAVYLFYNTTTASTWTLTTLKLLGNQNICISYILFPAAGCTAWQGETHLKCSRNSLSHIPFVYAPRSMSVPRWRCAGNAAAMRLSKESSPTTLSISAICESVTALCLGSNLHPALLSKSVPNTKETGYLNTEPDTWISTRFICTTQV